MDASIELIFLLVFFVPMAIMVTMNLVLDRTLPDVTAPWARLVAPRVEPQPDSPREAPVPVAAQVAEVSNEDEALEAA
jgi:hypothetical protein